MDVIYVSMHGLEQGRMSMWAPGSFLLAIYTPLLSPGC